MKKETFEFYVGIVNNHIDFFHDENYYSGIMKADIFKSKQSALKCYDDIKKVKLQFIE